MVEDAITVRNGRGATGSALARLWALALVLITASAATAAQAPEVTARLSTGVAKLGSEVRLFVQVDGPRDARIVSLPEVDGLDLGPVGAPSSSSRVFIAGGQRLAAHSLIWTVPIRARRTGEFTIPPIGIEAGGERLATREQALRVVQDIEGEELGYFEFTHPERVYEGEPFTLDMTFGWDAAFDGQPGLYANLSLPWMGQLPGTLEVGDGTAPRAATVEIALNSRGKVRVQDLGQRTLDGRRLRLLRLEKRMIATRAGVLEFPTSHLVFGRQTAGNFFNERRIESEYFKRSPGFAIDVRELPEEGRPFGYTGAVGRIEARADVDRREVDAGESIKLTVEWTGKGNLEFFEPPDPARIDAFDGFRVYGMTDKKSFDRRIVVYDLAPVSDETTEIPPLPLAVFDTQAERYTEVVTRSIPIRVRALAGAGLASDDAVEYELDIRDIQPDPVAGEGGGRPGAGAVLGTLGAVLAGWGALRTAVRRGGDPGSVVARTRRAARRVLARELGAAASASAEARALRRYLAARTGEPEQAWLGRAVEVELGPRGEGRLAAEDARALDELFARLDERTWAGDDAPLGREAVLAVADRIRKEGL